MYPQDIFALVDVVFIIDQSIDHMPMKNIAAITIFLASGINQTPDTAVINNMIAVNLSLIHI